MDPERWKTVESLYHAALALDPGRRSTFLEAACPDDPELRREVESLIGVAAEADRMLPDDVQPRGSPELRAQLEGLLDRSRASIPAAFAPGEVLGERFRIVGRLGAGGMGEVYEAEDTVLGESIALKTIRSDVVDRAEMRARFVQEVHAAKRIAHPNVCRIHDLHQHRAAGNGGAITFLTMELLHGETLRARLARGALPLAEARPMAGQLAAALEAAHRAGVIHRDFKSENVILAAAPDGGVRAVVTDFGLARSQSVRAASASLTTTGQIVGTPAYMAPEQLLGEPITAAVDIYAFGVVLYEMVTGTQPFSGDSPLAVAARRLESAPPPPGTRAPGLPPQWETAILRCLERDPDKRFAHAADVWTAIESGADSFQNATTAALGRRHVPIPRRAWLAAALLLAIAAVLLWRPLVNRSARAPAKGIYLAVLPFKALGDNDTLRYQSEGITDALAARLFQLPDVHLASRAAVDGVQNQPAAKMARALGVTMLIHGSVENAAGAGQITAVVSLEDAGGQRLLWTDRFSSSPGDLLGLEDQIYNRLTRALNISLSGEQMARAAAHPTENLEAYDLYLQARDAVRRKRDEANLKSAIDLYTKALARDPRFGLAYASLADACMFMYDLKKDSFWSEKALHAAAEAERWSPDAPESHIAMGSAYRATGRTTEAITEFRHALDLAPNSDEACRRLASAYTDSGDRVQAIAYYRKAIDANPYYWMNYNQLGRAYLSFGEYGQALESYRKVAEIAPDIPTGYINMAAIYFHEGQYERAIEYLGKAIERNPTFLIYANLAECYYNLGQFQKAVENGEKAVALNRNSDLAAGNLADAYRWSGQPEKARAAYEHAISLAYASLQVNPRNADVMARLALYYAKQGQYDRARQYIDRARGVDPNDVELMFDQGLIESLMGDANSALRDLRQAVAKGYSVAQIASEPDLNRLRQTRGYQDLIAGGRAARH